MKPSCLLGSSFIKQSLVCAVLHPRLPSRAHEQVWLQDSHLEVDAGLESLTTVSLSLRQPCEEHTMITPRFGAGKQALARGRGDVGVTWVGRGGTESLEPNPALPDRPSSVMSYLGDLGESLPL